MGCASSGPLPFLTNRGNQAVAASPRMNGEPPYELKMVNNKLRENGVAKDVNEAYVSEKMKEVEDSTVVQNVVAGAMETKDEIVSQVKGFGEALSEKMTSAADSIEEAMQSAIGNLTDSVDSFEDKLTSEVTSMEEKIKSVLAPGADATLGEVKAEDIDELLDSLPAEEEVTEAVKTTAEEVADTATEGVKGGDGE